MNADFSPMLAALVEHLQVLLFGVHPPHENFERLFEFHKNRFLVRETAVFAFLFFENTSDFIVSLVPFGGNVINSLFTNGAPFKVYPGERGRLSTDAQQWFVQIFYFDRQQNSIRHCYSSN